MRAKRGKITFERGDLVEYAARDQETGKVFWREYHVILDFNCFERDHEIYMTKKYCMEGENVNRFYAEYNTLMSYSRQDLLLTVIIAKANKTS